MNELIAEFDEFKAHVNTTMILKDESSIQLQSEVRALLQENVSLHEKFASVDWDLVDRAETIG
jgi:hypothetical protein